MSYNRHIKFHERGGICIHCDMCDDKFEEDYQLISHKKKHDEAKLPCLFSEDCEKKFKHKGDQTRHFKFGHHETKDFSCKVCGKCFQSPQLRSGHEKKCCDFMETDQNTMLDEMTPHDLSMLLKTRK